MAATIRRKNFGPVAFTTRRAEGELRRQERAQAGSAGRSEGDPVWLGSRADASRTPSDQEQPLVVPQFTHLWQLPFGIMIEPHSGQVGASVRAMKL